jgi:CheY-like chemotaxis protein
MSHSGRERILVVDDLRDSADSLRAVMEMLGAEAHAAYDGPSALEKIRALRPTVVLLDIGMPGMDGHEVARRVRAEPELDAIRLIALTGWGTADDRHRTRESGFDDHWVKPVAPEKLKSLLRDPGN